jgi:O-Antigen ligase
MKITEKQFAYASVFSVVGLLCIWVIPNTIALRHLLLVAGFLSAVGLISYNWEKLRSVNASYLPLFCILGLFAWVFIHYTFFSLNPQLELSEIKGLWMRSLVGAIAAIGLGIAIVKYSKLRLYFYMALFLTPAINVLAYCWASFLNRGFVKPNDFVFFLFAKIETAYFGAIAAAIATGNLILLMGNKIDKPKTIHVLFWVGGLLLVLVSALISSTKNGIAIALGLCAFLAAVVAINSIQNKNQSKALPAIVLLTIALLSVGVWEGHKSLAYRGWDTVFQDAALGLDIDGNKQWQKREGSVPAPLNSNGVEAALNTYSRFAYAAVGTRLISQYPLGYGSINQSFKGLQEVAQIPHEHEGQVHSGWIDFGLAFGIPGLVLIFTSLLSIIYFGLRSKSSIALPWVMICLAFIPFGLIAEITYKQYFEATIFFLTVGSTVIILIGKKDKYLA